MHTPAQSTAQTNTTEQATLGGGCFWCLEAVFQQVRGVLVVESGYTGGAMSAPTYEAVCGGHTGHAEVVQITFNSAEISYGELLEIFFAIHDPTTLNRQGNDVGTQYRSSIFPHNPTQRTEAERVMADLSALRIFNAPLVTTLEPLDQYWKAEEYHQNYYRQHPEQGYCAFVVSPKVSKFRQKFAHRLIA